MPRSDYLMRIVQQFSKALAALLQRTQSLNREPTLAELGELSSSFAGFDLNTLAALDTDQILQLYSITGALDVEKAYVAGMLLHRLALLEGDGQIERKALDVLQAVKEAYGEYVNKEHEALIFELQDRVSGK